MHRPNVVFIFADDLGIGDVGAYGCGDIPTPQIDSIAENGVRCVAGYVTSPQCGPSRAGVLTGRYQQRFGYEANPPVKRSFELGLPLEETMVFTRLKRVGYRTGVVGKWHMGRGEGYRPWERNVDFFYGVLNGTSWYFPPFAWAAGYLGLDDSTDIHRNDEIYLEEDADYITDAFARECADFIGRNAGRPFFLYAPFTAPHVPIQSRARHLERVAHIGNEKRRNYAAVVVGLDDAVGVILQALEKHGLREKTLLFFISDNGASEKDGGSNGPYRGFKGNLFEGGIRVPYLVQWPGTLPARAVYEHPVSTLDVAATAAALAGSLAGGGKPLDGVNLIPYLAGEKDGAPHQYLFFKQYAWADLRAVRHGDWKLVGHSENETLLFNLAEDPGETRNVKAAYPEAAEKLQRAWEQWRAGTVPPAWSWGSE